ncbi:hypothetical protein BDAP_001460 [Binucleata daphniae]
MNLGDVLLAGCGGTGTEIAKLLVFAEYKSITFVDYDQIEETNLNRQYFYCKSDIGKYKAKVLCNKIEELHKGNVMENKNSKDCCVCKNNVHSQSSKQSKSHKNTMTYKNRCSGITKHNMYESNIATVQNQQIYKTREKQAKMQNILLCCNKHIKQYSYKLCKIEELENTTYDTIFCCLDSISSRMSLNLFDFKRLIDLGVEGNKLHVKKVIRNNETSCLYCIKDMYNNEDNLHVCTQRDINLLTNRNEILKFMVAKYNDIDKVMQEFNLLCTTKNYKPTNSIEIENIMKNIITSVSYTNSICASLAMVVLNRTEYDFIFYNGYNFTKICTQKKSDCIVCKHKSMTL